MRKRHATLALTVFLSALLLSGRLHELTVGDRSRLPTAKLQRDLSRAMDFGFDWCAHANATCLLWVGSLLGAWRHGMSHLCLPAPGRRALSA